MTTDTTLHSPANDDKAPGALRTISEVADELGVPTHVLRFWESKFPQIKPMYHHGRRYYRPQDVDTLTKIQHLLKQEGYTIKGAKKAFFGVPNEPEKLSETQHSQLAVIRQELITLRDTLKRYVA